MDISRGRASWRAPPPEWTTGKPVRPGGALERAARTTRSSTFPSALPGRNAYRSFARGLRSQTCLPPANVYGPAGAKAHTLVDEPIYSTGGSEEPFSLRIVGSIE